MTNRLPACVSIPLSKLCEAARAFIENCNQFEERAQAIGNELQELSDEYKKMETETTCKNRTGGALKGLGYVAALTTAFGVGFSVSRGGDKKKNARCRRFSLSFIICCCSQNWRLNCFECKCKEGTHTAGHDEKFESFG